MGACTYMASARFGWDVDYFKVVNRAVWLDQVPAYSSMTSSVQYSSIYLITTAGW